MRRNLSENLSRVSTDKIVSRKNRHRRCPFFFLFFVSHVSPRRVAISMASIRRIVGDVQPRRYRLVPNFGKSAT